jgi:hypothetical protein
LRSAARRSRASRSSGSRIVILVTSVMVSP